MAMMMSLTSFYFINEKQKSQTLQIKSLMKIRMNQQNNDIKTSEIRNVICIVVSESNVADTSHCLMK
jgi:hypothetical protein